MNVVVFFTERSITGIRISCRMPDTRIVHSVSDTSTAKMHDDGKSIWRSRMAITNPEILSRTSAVDRQNPMDHLFHICDRSTTPHGSFLSRLRQTNRTPWLISFTSATDQPHPMAHLFHVCVRPSKPLENLIGCLRQTSHTS